MAWAWAAILIFIALFAVGIFVVTKVLISVEKKREASRSAELMFGDFTYTPEEWEYVHPNQFVDDTRGRGLLDRCSGIISWGGNRSAPTTRGIKFSDQNIYLTGDGEQKILRVQSLNPWGTDVRLRSLRLLDLEPLKKLQIMVAVSQRLDGQRVNFDLEYLIPLPRSAHSSVQDIERKYGELVLAATN